LKEWIIAAVEITRDRFNEKYANVAPKTPVKQGDKYNKVTVHTYFLCSTDTSPLQVTVNKSANIFDNLPSLSQFTSAPVDNELDVYLKTPIENVAIGDGIQWWFRNRHTFPCLSRMALDYLSIPGV
jgi:hypothetical protein